MVGTLSFARRLSRFESTLAREASPYHPGNESFRSLAQSYVTLLDGLVKFDEEHPEAGISDLLSEAIDVYEQGEADLRNQQDAEYARRERSYEKAQLLHEKVVQIECPFCHAPAGTDCSSRDGSSLGVSDHKARKRAAQAG
jgi:hypothetical protein